VDEILADNPKLSCKTKYESSQTLTFKLAGSYTRIEAAINIDQLPEVVESQYEDHFVFEYDLPRDVAKYLINTYGTQSLRVVELGKKHNLNQRLIKSDESGVNDYPFLKSQVLYAIQSEMAQKPNDILCRRVPLAFLNKDLALGVLPEVVEMMAKEKKWSTSQKKAELEEAIKNMAYLK
jgi:glycerol-3-phosphate dehydrogenase